MIKVAISHSWWAWMALRPNAEIGIFWGREQLFKASV